MAYDKAYYEANKEQIKAKNKAYREANKEQIKDYNKAYNEANREKIKDYNKAYKKANPEKIKASSRAYREANKEKIKAYKKAYREANKEQIKAYYEANKEKAENCSLKYKYNITLKERNLMLKKQKKKCKICNVTFSKIKFGLTERTTACIDHCHTTNKVRGILCNLCNVGLGSFKDNTEILTKAINYLKETETLPEELR